MNFYFGEIIGDGNWELCFNFVVFCGNLTAALPIYIWKKQLPGL